MQRFNANNHCKQPILRFHQLAVYSVYIISSHELFVFLWPILPGESFPAARQGTMTGTRNHDHSNFQHDEPKQGFIFVADIIIRF